MRAHAAAFLGHVETRPESAEAGIAHRIVGSTHWFAGEYVEAQEHLEWALALFQPGRDDDLAFRFGQDPGVAAMLNLAITLWPIGDVGRAVSLVGAGEARIAALAHAHTRVYGNNHAAMFELMRGNYSRAVPRAIEVARLAREHDLSLWRAAGIFLDGLARAQGGAPGGGLEDMIRGIELQRDQSVLTLDGLLKIALAEVEARAGDVDRAVAILDEALATSERTGHRAFDAELNRIRGEMLLKRDPASPAPAEDAFQTAIAVAKHQGTRSFQLRAALALVKLDRSTGRAAGAHAVLASALEGFSPTPEMAEIAEAQALLAAFAETEEVKAARAQERRRAQLHVAYCNALIQVRGYGSPETAEAFAAVRESDVGGDPAPERSAIDYGLWAGSYVRGELPAMRAHAAAFLRDVEAKPNSPEAGVAHRCLGGYPPVRRRVRRSARIFGARVRALPAGARRRSGVSFRT